MAKNILLIVAAVSLAASQAFAVPSPAIKRAIEKDMKALRGTRFDNLADTWANRFGAKAGPALYELAQQKNTKDSHRYMAILSAARLGAAPKQAQIENFLKDPVWMVRVAMLRALPLFPHQLKAEELEKSLKTGLRDKALVVRLEAVEATRKLQPPGMFDWLATTLVDASNFHRGKSQWVPDRVLEVFSEYADTRQAAQLKPLLTATQDQKLLRKAVKTLEVMTGMKLDPKLSLQAQVQKWIREI